MTAHDCIVLGVGGMGSAACRTLAQRGVSVLGLEQHSIAHDRGSSHGQSRIIRKAYFEHADYVPLLHRAYALWREIERESGRDLFRRTGLLMFGAPASELIVGVRRAAGAHGLPLQELSRGDVAERFPLFVMPQGSAALLEEDAGVLAVEACVQTMADLAVRSGATIRQRVRVLNWSADSRGVTVRTENETHRAARLVITAGPWSAALLGEIGAPLRVLRRMQLWFGVSDARTSVDRGFPVFCYDVDGFFYGFPSLDGVSMKVAEHTGAGDVADADALDRAFHPHDAERVQRFVASHVLGVSGEVQRFAACMYTMTPDGHFLLDAHPEHANVVFAAGFSGHGFKFAPIVGEVLADLVLDGATREPIGFLRLGRLVRA